MLTRPHTLRQDNIVKKETDERKRKKPLKFLPLLDESLMNGEFLRKGKENEWLPEVCFVVNQRAKRNYW